MAKRKTVPYVWVCSETNQITGSGRAPREKLKDMGKLRYSPRLQKRTEHAAKPVKKGGTKALENAK